MTDWRQWLDEKVLAVDLALDHLPATLSEKMTLIDKTVQELSEGYRLLAEAMERRTHMAVTCNDVMSNLRRLLVRLENAEAQAERCIAEATAYRTAICALQVEISVIAAVLRVLVDAMAEDLREQPGDVGLMPSQED